MSEQLSGVLLVNKPRGLTSHDVVARLRRLTRMRRIGHTGTLDPMAEGLLVICLGPATRAVQFLTGLPKEYSGTIKLGAMSSTYDAEGSIMAQDREIPADPEKIQAAMNDQRGSRLQLAPPYSAVKVNGKKLYEYARQGEEVPEKNRRVQIYSFELLDYRSPEIKFHARVGSGTYIRSMAHDLGIQLGCGGFLAGLHRDSVGQFRSDDALALEDFELDPSLIELRLMTLAESLGHLPRVTVGPGVEADILNGKTFTTREILICEHLPKPAETTVVLNESGRVLSIVRSEPIPANGKANGHDSDPAAAAEPILPPLLFRPIRVLAREN